MDAMHRSIEHTCKKERTIICICRVSIHSLAHYHATLFTYMYMKCMRVLCTLFLNRGTFFYLCTPTLAHMDVYISFLTN